MHFFCSNLYKNETLTKFKNTPNLYKMKQWISYFDEQIENFQFYF